MNDMTHLWNVIKYLPDKKDKLVFPVLILFLANAISLTIPVISIRVIDSLRMYENVSIRHLSLFMLAWMSASVLAAILEYIHNDRFRRYGDHVASLIFGQKFGFCLSQEFVAWKNTDAKKTADMIKKDIEDIYPLLCGLPFKMIRHALVGSIGIAMIVYINFKLALAIAILVPFYILTYLFRNDSIRNAYWRTRISSRDLWQKMVEYLQSVALVTYTGMAEKVSKETVTQFGDYLADEYSLFGSLQKRRIYTRIIASISPVYLALLAYLFLTYDLASPGEIFGFWGLFSLVISAATGITTEYTSILKSLTVFARIKQRPIPHSVYTGATPLSAPITQIECLNLSLKYAMNGSRPLRYPSFQIGQGEVVKLSGKSGSGKSTLLRLMIGLIKPDSGQVLINGIRRDYIEDISFFSQVGYVEQDGYIYSTGIRSNILIGRPFDQQKWRSVINRTGLDSVLISTEQKEIGENGSCLSGGERQRILLARALYDQPLWLFLDEPFRGIDQQTRNDIEKLLQNLHDHMTIVLVTHSENNTFSATKCIFLE